MNNLTSINIIIYRLIIIILFTLIDSSIHPTYLILTLISLNIIICSILAWSIQNSLFSIILFIIIIRGILIIFLYFACLISNEQSIINFNLMAIPALLILFLCLKNLPPLTSNEESSSCCQHIDFIFNNIKIIYEYPFTNLTIKCIIFLLIALFAIVKISSLKNLTLRKIKYEKFHKIYQNSNPEVTLPIKYLIHMKFRLLIRSIFRHSNLKRVLPIYALLPQNKNSLPKNYSHHSKCERRVNIPQCSHKWSNNVLFMYVHPYRTWNILFFLQLILYLNDWGYHISNFYGYSIFRIHFTVGANILLRCHSYH